MLCVPGIAIHVVCSGTFISAATRGAFGVWTLLSSPYLTCHDGLEIDFWHAPAVDLTRQVYLDAAPEAHCRDCTLLYPSRGRLGIAGRSLWCHRARVRHGISKLPFLISTMRSSPYTSPPHQTRPDQTGSSQSSIPPTNPEQPQSRHPTPSASPTNPLHRLSSRHPPSPNEAHPHPAPTIGHLGVRAYIAAHVHISIGDRGCAMWACRYV